VTGRGDQVLLYIPENTLPKPDYDAKMINSACPNLSFPHAVSGNPKLILSRFRPKDCRNDKNRGIS